MKKHFLIATLASVCVTPAFAGETLEYAITKTVQAMVYTGVAEADFVKKETEDYANRVRLVQSTVENSRLSSEQKRSIIENTVSYFDSRLQDPRTPSLIAMAAKNEMKEIQALASNPKTTHQAAKKAESIIAFLGKVKKSI